MINNKTNSSMIIILVSTVFFMEYLDSTAVITASPLMAKAFHTTSESMSIGISAYMLSLAVFIPISGWISKQYGIKNIFTFSIVAFLITSVLCSFCTNLQQFASCRFLQGAAGAMMVPVGRLAVLSTCGKKNLVNAIAWITTLGLIAPIIGPPIGGFLATYLSWHWIFFINIPIGLIISILSIRFMPKHLLNDHKTKLDIRDFILNGLSFAGIMVGTELLSKKSLLPFFGLATICLSIILLIISISFAKKRKDPFIDYSVLKIRTYSVPVFYGTISIMVIGATPFLLPLMYQEGMQLNAFQSGIMLLSLMAGNLLTKPATVWMMHHWTFKKILLANSLFLSLSTGLCALFDKQLPLTLMLGILFFIGCFRSIQLSTIHTLAFTNIPQDKMNAANTFFSTIQQMAAGLGIGLGALALQSAKYLIGSNNVLKYYQISFELIAIFGLIAIKGYLGLRSEDGSVCNNK